MDVFSVTETFKNKALIASDNNLLLKVIEDGNLNDQLVGFEVLGRNDIILL